MFRSQFWISTDIFESIYYMKSYKVLRMFCYFDCDFYFNFIWFDIKNRYLNCIDNDFKS